ncbi:MAG: substrate-binding domain-containing protein [Rhodospirillaceae bacterium]
MRIFITACTLCLLAVGKIAEAKTIFVIGNPNVPVSALSQQDLEKIYLLRQAYWSDGNLIVPVNREASSTLREFFSDVVLKQSPRSLSNYWNQMHFRGKAPPIVQSSDESVAAFVRKIPGAIGYVENAAGLDGVKIIAELP